jgi:hypothetical protein
MKSGGLCVDWSALHIVKSWAFCTVNFPKLLIETHNLRTCVHMSIFLYVPVLCRIRPCSKKKAFCFNMGLSNIVPEQTIKVMSFSRSCYLRTVVVRKLKINLFYARKSRHPGLWDSASQIINSGLCVGAQSNIAWSMKSNHQLNSFLLWNNLQTNSLIINSGLSVGAQSNISWSMKANHHVNREESSSIMTNHVLDY